jgi:hypothetical protein
MTMEVKTKVDSIGEVAEARDWVVCRLKDRLWRERWRSEIDIPGLKVDVAMADGGFIVKASIERVPGEDCGGPDRGQRTG